MGLKRLSLIGLVILLLSALPIRANAASVSDISRQFICQCGCTSVLSNCIHIECAVRDEMLTLIEERMAQGQTEAEITRFFVARYGEQVLASPPKRGFNLMAWVTPFAALLVGGGVIYAVLKKWVKRGVPTPTPAVTDTRESDEKYQRRLEEELKEFAERSFR